jgi:cell division protein FtsI/penicillin-binding protein 2
MLKKSIILIILFLIIIIRISYLNISNKEKYKELLNKKVNTYFYGESSPRGRILDCNGKVLVDNIGIKAIIYHKIKNISIDEELEIAESLANIIQIDINNNSLKKYYLIKNNNGDDLITKEEYELYKLRKISSKEIKRLKYERITDDMLSSLSIKDKQVATIYDLMSKGYSYQNKVILKGISDEIYSKIIDSNIKGVTIELTWERIYNYDDVLKDIFGRVGSIPKDELNIYLNKGYALNDQVGLSYLEKEYEEYLKGEKDLYKVNNDNTLTLISSGKKGSDLILSINIDTQLKLERIIKDNLLKAKKRKNTDYFKELYAIVGNPLTGEIIALSGQELINKGEFKSINTNIINSSFTVGSIVKMATISAGYQNKVIDIGYTVQDSCIKLYQIPIKCSYRRLGKINDLTAISKSSNYYQFNIAIKLTNHKYKYNMQLNTTNDDFNKLRSTYKEYGLGSITGIDLPNESIGIIGSNTSSDLLLNLTIGQYDTYTPIELFQYVNTIASLGEKRKPQLMKKIKNIENEYSVIGNVNLDIKYLERLKEAMHLATKSGTAKNYINSKYKPAGKTGTSETFVDTNNDGIMDTKTTSIAFLGFAPYDNPKYSLVILAPNLYVSKKYSYKKVYITRYISKSITNFLFENM